jgi:hypothetical protein
MNETEHTSPQEGNAGLDYLSELIRNATQRSEEENVSPSPPSGKTENPFSILLSDPNLLAKLPSLMAAADPIIEMLSASAPKGSAPSSPSQAVPAIAPQSAKKNEEHDRRTALLCAMKPYLSAERQAAVDQILKLSKLGDILKTL